jgi:hypothetical protein
MIATVRIAPVERWCRYYAERTEEPHTVAGREIRILTHACMSSAPSPDCDDEQHPEGVRWWEVDQSWKSEWEQYVGKRCGGRLICEHMLEMD